LVDDTPTIRELNLFGVFVTRYRVSKVVTPGSEDIVTSSLRKQEGRVIHIRHVEDPVVLGGRGSELEIDNAVGDGLAVDEHVHLALTLKGLREREFHPERGGGTLRVVRRRVSEVSGIHDRHLVAIHEVPELVGGAVITSIHITSIRHLEVSDRIPSERIDDTSGASANIRGAAQPADN
jgi:hypothetical protein